MEVKERFNMQKKSIFAAVLLIAVGLLGSMLVSNFGSGVEVQLAGGPQVTLGVPTALKGQTFDVKAASKAFIEVSKVVTPTVVSINVKSKTKERSENFHEFFRFFGPDFKFPETPPQMGSGSGVIVHPDGYIITNNHVVDGAEKDGIEVVLNDTRRFKGSVVGSDPTTDLAVIKIDASGLPTASIGNSDDLLVGEWVVAVGNPLGLNSTVTAGIVSAIGRSGIGVIRDNYRIENFIQTDAAINPGNSGGPLVNLNGEVVGINTAIATTNARYQGYGFAIPINLAKGVAEDLIAYGAIRRGYIGVQIEGVDETMSKALGLAKAQGVIVQNLVDGGAAKNAGIKEGDVILSVDDREMNSASELQSYIASKHPGDVVTLKVFRSGKTIERKVTLRARAEDSVVRRSSDTKSDGKETEPEPAAAVSFDRIGLSVRPLTSEQKKQFEVDGGVLVTDVNSFSEAANRNLGKNDVILEADRKEINSTKELKDIIEKKKPGDSVLLRVKKASGQTTFLAVQIPK
jgi:serine protease Do